MSEGTIPPIADDIFKMYDIRGIAYESLRTQDMYDIGRSFGTVSLLESVGQVVVACDSRESSPEFKDALIQGVCSTGCSVMDVGTVPTPLMYFAAHSLETASGLMVTASHNPPQYNGIKMLLAGQSLYGKRIQQLKERIRAGDYAVGQGGTSAESVVDRYCEAIRSDIELKRPLRVVLDCANGIGGAIAPRVLREIGCEVIELFCDVDNTFPNHPADPTVADNLRQLIEKVIESRADVGLALDGDADRMVAVSPSGEIIWPDRLMILFSQSILDRSPGEKIVFDVKCTRSLPEAIQSSGGQPIMWKTGHSLMKAKMKECDAVFGGEMSGHFFFADRWPGFDDGIYAGARLCELLSGSELSPQQLFDALPELFSTPEIRIHADEPHRLVELFSRHVELGEASVNTLDGVRADYEDGFGLIRGSNTAPEIVMRFEADSERSLQRIEKVFREGIETVKHLDCSE